MQDRFPALGTMRLVAAVGLLGVGLLVTVFSQTAAAVPCVAPYLATLGASAATARAVFPLRVVTLNIAEVSSPETALEFLSNTMATADVVLLQEALLLADEREDLLAVLARELGVQVLFASTTGKRLDGSLEGLAMVSRYPLRAPIAIPLPRFGLHFRSRCRVALAATVEAVGRDVRLVNVHLDTRINAARRLEQLEPALHEVRQFDGPAVIAGDMNTSTFHWLGHVIPIPYVQNQPRLVFEALHRQGFRSPQPEKGPVTFPMLQQRLDWIFLRGLEAGEWSVEPVEFSDHRAVRMTATPGKGAS